MTQTMERLVEYPTVERSKEQQELIEKGLAYLSLMAIEIEREKPDYNDLNGNIVLGYN
jgi:hypothetical protein